MLIYNWIVKSVVVQFLLNVFPSPPNSHILKQVLNQELLKEILNQTRDYLAHYC